MLDLSTFANQWALPIMSVLIAGGVLWLVKATTAYLDAHAKFLNAKQKAQIAALESSALDEGAQYLTTWLASQAKDAKIPMNSAVTRFATQIAMNHAAGVLTDNGASPEEVAAKILNRLPSISTSLDTTGVTIPSPEQVKVQSLSSVQ